MVGAYDRHPERKFAGPDGKPCGPVTRGLLQDLPVVATRIRRIGKEANEIDQIEVAVIEREDERLTIYDEGIDRLLVRVLQEIPTKDLCWMTGYSRSMVKYLKSGERKPSDEARLALVAVVAQHCRDHIIDVGLVASLNDKDVVGLAAGTLCSQLRKTDSCAPPSTLLELP